MDEGLVLICFINWLRICAQFRPCKGYSVAETWASVGPCVVHVLGLDLSRTECGPREMGLFGAELGQIKFAMLGSRCLGLIGNGTY